MFCTQVEFIAMSFQQKVDFTNFPALVLFLIGWWCSYWGSTQYVHSWLVPRSFQ